MTDRFKFRAWDTHCNRMRYEEDYAVVPDTGKPHWIHDQELIQGEAAQLILMQCTGLKDVNGKLIYESDIVQYERGLPDPLTGLLEVVTCTIEWRNGGFYIPTFNFNLKIIGNVYEGTN